MKITDKLIDSVVEEIANENGLQLVHTLKGRENVSEFKLASELRKEVNEVRNILYKLHSMNLVSFTRKKDREKGWYIYYWTFERNRVPDAYKKLNTIKLDALKNRFEREKASNFYVCPNTCLRLDFDQATDFSYHCPECGSILNQEEGANKLVSIKSEIGKLESSLKDFAAVNILTSKSISKSAIKVNPIVKTAKKATKMKIRVAKITIKKAIKSKVAVKVKSGTGGTAAKYSVRNVAIKKRIPLKAIAR